MPTLFVIWHVVLITCRRLLGTGYAHYNSAVKDMSVMENTGSDVSEGTDYDTRRNLSSSKYSALFCAHRATVSMMKILL